MTRTQMIIVSLVAIFWIWGWIAMIGATNVGQEMQGWQKGRGMAVLFVLWPVVAISIALQGDI